MKSEALSNRLMAASGTAPPLLISTEVSYKFSPQVNSYKQPSVMRKPSMTHISGYSQSNFHKRLKRTNTRTNQEKLLARQQRRTAKDQLLKTQPLTSYNTLVLNYVRYRKWIRATIINCTLQQFQLSLRLTSGMQAVNRRRNRPRILKIVSNDCWRNNALYRRLEIQWCRVPVLLVVQECRR